MNDLLSSNDLKKKIGYDVIHSQIDGSPEVKKDTFPEKIVFRMNDSFLEEINITESEINPIVKKDFLFKSLSGMDSTKLTYHYNYHLIL
ncbi:hypothetical protein [Persicobacter diffluens]|uniref:Uncharacterized protein n=1 Tax=Persicobacter diffluens TaxID=981 RepID=A0AAN5AMH2_9BACT|nr:hypothetical protein PEDI_56470 [Persicobacter diffluens]